MSFIGQLTEEEISAIENHDCGLPAVWRYKAMQCPSNLDGPHNLIPISWKITDKSKHVVALMCTRCFHEINIADAFQHRTKL